MSGLRVDQTDPARMPASPMAAPAIVGCEFTCPTLLPWAPVAAPIAMPG